MRNLKNIVDNYLSKPTDFAIQLVGKWGYGKTYYYRNILQQLILEKSTHDDDNKKYKPIYLSLFGLKSTEDIATNIVTEFYQAKIFKDYFTNSLRKRQLKVTQNILNIGLRGFLNFQRLGNPNDYLTDIKRIGKNVLNEKELVLCFDDLERKDSSLKIEDLTGYINSLVDIGIKVLIIANEDLLLKNEEQYKNLKEKIIGITIDFAPDNEETIKNIISTRFSGYKTFAEYLNQHLEILKKVLEAAENNFRHLIYALDSLQHCYSLIKFNILDSNHEIKGKLSEELNNINLFILAIAIEYKASILKYSDLSNYSDSSIFISKMLWENNQKNSEEPIQKTVLQTFLEKYGVEETEYHFYESIYSYVTGFNEFDTNIFIEEFKKKFNLNKGQVLPQYEVFESLSYQNIFKLSDREYVEKTCQAIEYAKDGLYAPTEYLGVMHCAERLNNIFDFNLEEVKEQLVEGLKKSVERINVESDVSFTQFEMSRGVGMSEINQSLHEIGMSIIDEQKQKTERNRIENKIQLLLNNFEEFIRRFHTDSNFKYQVLYFPFLKYIDHKQLLHFLTIADGNNIHLLESLIKDIYRNQEVLKQDLEDLKDFANTLNEYVDSINQKEGYKLRHYILSEFLESLNKFVVNNEK